MSNKVIRNIITAVRSPSNIPLYLRYQLSKIFNSGNAAVSISKEVRLTGFVDYSEYRSTLANIKPGELAFLRSVRLQPGDIIDVGANIGLISILLAKRFPDRTIHSFEPNPVTIRSLSANVSLNTAPNIVINSLAVSDITGNLDFICKENSRATARLTILGETPSLSVNSIRLDDYIARQNAAKIAFLKIDVEGFESAVLDGAEGLLRTNPDMLVYYEVCPGNCILAGKDPMAATDMLLRSDYFIYSITEQGQVLKIDKPDAGIVTLTNWLASRTPLTLQAGTKRGAT